MLKSGAATSSVPPKYDLEILHPLTRRLSKTIRPTATTTTPSTTKVIIPTPALPGVSSEDTPFVKGSSGVGVCVCSSTTSGGEVAVAADVAGGSFVGAPVGVLVDVLVGSVGTSGGVQVGVGETRLVITGGPATGSDHP